MNYTIAGEPEKIERFVQGPVKSFVEKGKELKEEADLKKSSYDLDEVHRFNLIEREVLDYFEELDKGLSEEGKKTARAELRKHLPEVYSDSPLCTKPLQKALHFDRTGERLFPGDLEALTYIYSNEPPTKEGFGNVLDLHFLERPLARAIRGRMELVTRLLHEDLVSKQDSESYKAASLASGPAHEWYNVLPLIKDKSRLNIMLLDQDLMAINATKRRLDEVQGDSNIVHLGRDIKDLATDPSLFGSLCNSDLAYSVGLEDYIGKYMSLLVDARYHMTKKGGRIWASFKQADHYNPIEYDALANWTFKREGRTEEGIDETFMKELPWYKDTEVVKHRDPRTGIVLLYDMHKD